MVPFNLDIFIAMQSLNRNYYVTAFRDYVTNLRIYGRSLRICLDDLEVSFFLGQLLCAIHCAVSLYVANQ